MAKYEITYSCGHAETKQLYGPHHDRDRYVAWAGDHKLCSACYEAKLAAERAAASAAAAETAAAAGLPALEGSPKQIAWAEQIRRETLEAPGNQVPDLVVPAGLAGRYGLTEEDLAARAHAIHDATVAARRQLETEASAKCWIDHRGRRIGDHVDAARSHAEHREMRDVYERERERAAEQESKTREDKERRERERQASEAERAAKAAATFRVGGAGSVQIDRHRAVKIQSTDGLEATGHIQGGEWIIGRIGGYHLGSQHPEMERIAREAKAVWEASR